MALRRALSRIDLDVKTTEADSVAGAGEALANGDFDCVIVDHNLPDGVGIDVLEAMRGRSEPIPVIVLTGQGDEDLAVELMKEGARDYIPKAHLSPARLSQSLRHVVDVTRAERETRRARQAQRFLVDVSAELARSIEYDATMARIAELPVPEMADYALLHLRESADRIRLVAAAHRDPELARSLSKVRVLDRREEHDSPLFAAMESGEAVLVREVDEAWIRSAAHDEGHLRLMRANEPRSLILVPLKARGKILGSLAVAYSSSGRRYDDQDVAVIQNLAGRAALALDNARLYQDLRDEVELMDTLRRLGEAITAELDMESMVTQVTDRTKALTGADFGAYFRRDEDGWGGLELYCVTGVPQEAVEGMRPGFATDGSVVRSSDGWDSFERQPTAGSEEGRPPLGSHLTVPVIRDEELMGALFFGHAEVGAFGEQDERILRGVASWAAVAIQNARLYEGAQEAARARDDMLAVVSHDLRNPLNVIATSAALILEIPLPEEKKRLQLETIRRTTERMNRLIQDLLDVTSIEAGKLHIEAVPVRATELVEEACDTMEPLVVEEGVRLERRPSASGVAVAVDRERIAQVFGNLIGNAIRFTPKEGRIVVGNEEDEGLVRFYVEDTGPGIEPDQQEHLFDRFWRGEHQGATGAGLGLPIARGIVEMHGGTITVESDPPRGSRFTFSLPTAERGVKAAVD